jgi:hypothetical protein
MLHEERKNLTAHTLDMKRAIDSLREELEAIDWYMQRADAAEDKYLKNVLIHNRREEAEHFAMMLEWVRQNDKNMDEKLRQYLFADKKDIVKVEEKEEE